MKKLILLPLFLLLAACAKSGDSAPGAVAKVVDSTPHNYEVHALSYAGGLTVIIHLKMVCDFGLPTQSTFDQTKNATDTDGIITTCTGAKNATLQITNSTAPILGTVVLVMYVVVIDGVPGTTYTLPIGQTYNWQKGF